MVNEHELRALVRSAVQRHLHEAAGSDDVTAWTGARAHASHGRFPVLSGGETDGPCLIEPAVKCSHCGYCQSMGH